MKLNRKARRQMGMKGISGIDPDMPLLQITQQQLDAMLKAERDKVLKDYVAAVMAAAAMGVQSELELPHEDLVKVMKRIKKQFDCINAGTVTVKDLLDYCNIDLKLNITR